MQKIDHLCNKRTKEVRVVHCVMRGTNQCIKLYNDFALTTISFSHLTFLFIISFSTNLILILLYAF